VWSNNILLCVFTVIFLFGLGIWMLVAPDWFAERNKLYRPRIATTRARVRIGAAVCFLIGVAAVALAVSLWLHPF
jgi:hypothetical protein